MCKVQHLSTTQPEPQMCARISLLKLFSPRVLLVGGKCLLMAQRRQNEQGLASTVVLEAPLWPTLGRLTAETLTALLTGLAMETFVNQVRASTR